MIPTWGCSTFPKPTLDLDFAGATSLDSRITFTRASTATFFNSLGVLSTAASGAARFDYNPTTLAPQGLLIEEQRTNSIRNNTMVGAVAGTPGTNPTNWAFVTTQSNGLSIDLVGTGTENGITYIDYRFYGTTVNTNAIVIGIDFGSALTGQTWTGSTYWKLAAGSLTGITSSTIGLIEQTSGGSFVAGAFYSQTAPTTAALSTQRPSATRTLSGGATVARCQMNLNINVANATAIDITLRIGLPQLEQGAFATSVIPTTTTALTRNADVASMTGTNFSSWYNASEGTLYAECSFSGISTTANKIVNFDNGAGFANSIDVYAPSVTPRFDVYVSSAAQAALTPAPGTQVPLNTNVKISGAYATNNFAVSRNGGAVSTDSLGNVPTVSRACIGNSNLNAQFLNGTIRSIRYYPVRLANAQLQALTA